MRVSLRALLLGVLLAARAHAAPIPMPTDSLPPAPDSLAAAPAADSSVASRDTSATAMRDSAVVIVTRPATPAKGRVVAAPEPPYRIEADRKANGNARVMKHLNAHPERQAARKAYRRTQMARVMLPGVRRLKTTIGSLLSMHSEIAVASITFRPCSSTWR